MERSYDKVSRRNMGEGGRGRGGGEREEGKEKREGGEVWGRGRGDKAVGDRGRLRIRLGVEYDQGRRGGRKGYQR